MEKQSTDLPLELLGPAGGSAGDGTTGGVASPVQQSSARATGPKAPAGSALRGPRRWLCCSCWAVALVPLIILPILIANGEVARARSGGLPGRNATKVGLGSVDPNATCNDGTEAVYYYAQATDPAKKATWLIWLQGGGSCQDETTCKARAKPLTSSAPSPKGCGWLGCCACYSNSMELGAGGGMMSDADPSFGGANMAYVNYCTSDLWMGDRGASSDTFGFAFRGSRVVKAVLRSLVDKGLGATPETMVILSGCSAGAMGSTVLCDHVDGWLQRLDVASTKLKVVCVFDSNLPVLDVPVSHSSGDASMPYVQGQSMAASMPSIITLYGVPNELFNPACVRVWPDAERWKCVFPQYVLPDLVTPYFMLSSRFDLYGASLETSDTEAWAWTYFGWLWPVSDENLNAWGEAQGAVTASLPTDMQPFGAVFQPGCMFHCGQIDNAVYARMTAGDGTTLRDALHAWFQWTVSGTQTVANQRKWIDPQHIMALRGSCWGGTDLWVSVFRASILVWLVWGCDLGLQLAAKRGVTPCLMATGAKAVKAFRSLRGLKGDSAMDPSSGHSTPFGGDPTKGWICGKQHFVVVAWAALWVIFFVLCVLCRNY